MKGKEYISCCLFLLFLLISKISAEVYWHQFISNNDIRALAWDGGNDDLLWIGTDGGLLSYNVATGSIGIFNTLNSVLPTNNITSLVTTADNHLWIGTDGGGLIEYTGNSFIIYNRENSSLLSNRIKKIQTDENDLLWVFYRAGELTPFTNDSREDDTGFRDSNQYSGSYDMDVVSSADIWFSGWDYGSAFIKHYDGESWSRYNYYANSIKKAQDGYIWITRYNRVSKFIDITSDWITYEDLPVSGLNSIYIDSDNTKWFGSSSGLVKYNDLEWELFTTANSAIPSNRILSLLEDRNGNGLWIGTARGLALLNGTDFAAHDVNVSGLLSNEIRDTVVDQNGVIWLATDRGLCLYDGYSFTAYTSLNSPLTSDQINSLVIDNDNRIWIATNGGLFKYDEGIWEHFNTSNSFLETDQVQIMTLDHYNNLYLYVDNSIGYQTFRDPIANLLPLVIVPASSKQDIQRIYYADPGNMTAPLNTLSGLHLVTLLVVDNNNELWFNQREIIFLGDYTCIWDYLYKFDGSYIYEMLDLSQEGAILFYSAQPEEDGLWFGTSRWQLENTDWSYSVFFMENEEITTFYNVENSDLPHRDVFSLLKDENSFWLGTAAGAVEVRDDEWMIYDSENSLMPSNRVTGIFKDHESRVWFITDKGIAVYGEELDTDEGLLPTVSFLTLYPPYPNPFSRDLNTTDNRVNLRFDIPYGSIVKLDVYNIKGQHIRSIYEQSIESGFYHLTWDGKNSAGRAVAAGVYLLRIETDKEIQATKLLIIK